MELIDEIEESLSVFKKLYDNIRIIDPISKKIIIVKYNKTEKINNICCIHWNNDTFCKNCISKRAYDNNDTFVKIEYTSEKIILVTAIPIEIQGRIFIAEALKDITKNGSELYKIADGSDLAEELISSMDENEINTKILNVSRCLNELIIDCI